MSKKKDAAAIGAFVIGALALLVTAIVVWGSGRLFRETAEYVCYFDGSVNGLEVGAPVKARGVPVGKVVHIRLRYRQRPTDYRIPVFIEVDVNRLVELGAPRLPAPDVLRDLIASGLRARLETQSIITGTLFVNLGTFPASPMVMSELDPGAGYEEIPTVPTELAEVGKSVTAVLANLEAVDFAGLARSVDGAAASVDRLVSADHLPKVLAEAAAAIASYRRLADHVDAGLPPLLAQLQSVAGDARKTLVGLDGAAGAAGRLVAPQAPLSFRLGEALTDVARAANALRELADYLRRNPNALLVGKAR
jgi:paraquat-inducible protein B